MAVDRVIEIEDNKTGLYGYLAIDDCNADISFGGMRFDESVSKDMVEELAENMSLKIAGQRSSIGGAKAGIKASPDDPRLKDWLRQFAEICREELTRHVILGKDMGAQQWMLNEIYQTLGIPQLGLMHRKTGVGQDAKYIYELNGYIKHMTGKGVFWAINQARKGRIAGMKVLIQGAGIVSIGLAYHLQKAGAVVVGVSDRDKAIVCSSGIPVERIMSSLTNSGVMAVAAFPKDCVLIGRDKLLEQEADVLALVAGSYLVDRSLATRILCPLVVEGANLALLDDARDDLYKRLIQVVPDAVAGSSSAALVAHQIEAGNRLNPDKLWVDIKTNIERNTDETQRISRQLQINTKEAFKSMGFMKQNLYKYAEKM